MDDSDGSGKADQAIKQFRMMHKPGVDVAALCNACVKLTSAQFVKILRLETEPEPGRPLLAIRARLTLRCPLSSCATGSA